MTRKDVAERRAASGAGLKQPPRPCASGAGRTVRHAFLVIRPVTRCLSFTRPGNFGDCRQCRGADRGCEDGRIPLEARGGNRAVRLSSTRIHAIDVGSVYQFRFEPGGRRYLAVPTDSDALTTSPDGNRHRHRRSAAICRRIGNLPERPGIPDGHTVDGARVRLRDALPRRRDMAWSAAVARVPNGGDFTSAVWSPPIIFRPDGTAMDAALNVVDQTRETAFSSPSAS